MLYHLLCSSQHSARFEDKHCKQMKQRCRKHLGHPSCGWSETVPEPGSWHRRCDFG